VEGHVYFTKFVPYKHAFRKTFHLDRREVLLMYEVSDLGVNALVFRKLFQVIEVTFFINFVRNNGASGSVVGWDTSLQVGRYRVRFPLSLDFSTDLILPDALGST
jgi:hypothetical protein